MCEYSEEKRKRLAKEMAARSEFDYRKRLSQILLVIKQNEDSGEKIKELSEYEKHLAGCSTCIRLVNFFCNNSGDIASLNHIVKHIYQDNNRVTYGKHK